MSYLCRTVDTNLIVDTKKNLSYVSGTWSYITNRNILMVRIVRPDIGINDICHLICRHYKINRLCFLVYGNLW